MFGKAAHGPEEAQHLLHMMPGVVGLLANFHQHVPHIGLRRIVPAMRQVQLITEDQSDYTRLSGFLLVRHRSLQYFTSVHTFSHFLRHWNGRAQVAHTFSSRMAGGRCRGMAQARISPSVSLPYTKASPR